MATKSPARPVDHERDKQLAELAERMGVPHLQHALLDQALTHSSYANEDLSGAHPDNQRLEYLGDAVLGLLVAEWLYDRYPDAPEGELTSMRTFVVRSESLAQAGRDLDLGSYLRMGRGEEGSGGREREANLCAAVEAVVGAVYLDCGIATTRALVRQFLEAKAPRIDRQRTQKNAKTYLQEYTQSALQVRPTYVIVAEEGPGHLPCFVAQVLVGDEVWGEGSGRTKREAEQAAARAAIERRAL